MSIKRFTYLPGSFFVLSCFDFSYWKMRGKVGNSVRVAGATARNSDWMLSTWKPDALLVELISLDVAVVVKAVGSRQNVGSPAQQGITETH